MTDVIQRLQTAYEDYEVLSEANAFEGQVQQNMDKDVEVSVEFPLAEKDKEKIQEDQNTSKVTDRTLTNKIADFGIDTGQAIVSGMEDAGINFNQFLAEVVAAPDTLADFIGQKITDNPNFNYPGLDKKTATKNIQDGLSWMDENLVPKFLRGSTKNIERKYTNQTYGNIIQGVSQFATGAVPAAKIVGLTKALPGMIAPSSAARGLTWGMIADATVIDPNAEELIAPVFRTFITNSTKDEIDTLEDTVLSILEKYDQDNDLIKRIKTANEGALIGALVEGIIAGAKALPWKTLTKALGVAGAASIAAGKKVVDTAKRVEIDDSATLSANPIPFRLKPKKTTDSKKNVNNTSMKKQGVKNYKNKTLYHGSTNKNLQSLDIEKSRRVAMGDIPAIHITDSPILAKAFTKGELGDQAEGQIYEIKGDYNIINLDTDEGKAIWSVLDKNPNKAIDAGYDGVEFTNVESIRVESFYKDIPLKDIQNAKEIKLFKSVKLQP